MKRQLIFFFVLLFSAYNANAQCTSSDVIFSSYFEGSNDNQCIELYNGTGSTVDLSDYTIHVYLDGETFSSLSIPLSSMLGNQETFLICNAFCLLPYCTNADIQSVDFFFDGNDALELDYLGTGVDCFGTIGEDPTADGWGTSSCTTTDHTLIRDLTGVTCTGSGTCASSFDPVAWLDGGLCLPIDELPVKLASFQVRALDNGDVSIDWATESEVNTEKFVVQHSYEGGNFETIATQSAKGTSNLTIYYTEIHEKPQPGKHYYRLKIVDTDGKFDFSPVRAVSILADGITIAPNPAYDVLNVHFNALVSDINIQIMDISGKLIKNFTTGNQLTHTEIDITALASGQYFVKVIAGNEFQVLRFIKTN